jgi:hypothetical protein
MPLLGIYLVAFAAIKRYAAAVQQHPLAAVVENLLQALPTFGVRDHQHALTAASPEINTQ